MRNARKKKTKEPGLCVRLWGFMWRLFRWDGN